MAEFLSIMAEEAETSIAAAFAEGYKAGRMRAAGAVAYYKSLYESYQKSDVVELSIPLWSAPVLLVVGFAGGLVFGAVMAR